MSAIGISLHLAVDATDCSQYQRGSGHGALISNLAMSSLRMALGAVSYCYQENRALAFCVGTEETDHVVVEESESCRAQPLRVRSQVQLASKNARLQLYRSISTIAKSLQNRPQVRKKENVNGSFCRQLLLKSASSPLGRGNFRASNIPEHDYYDRKHMLRDVIPRLRGQSDTGH